MSKPIYLIDSEPIPCSKNDLDRLITEEEDIEVYALITEEENKEAFDSAKRYAIQVSSEDEILFVSDRDGDFDIYLMK
jgi:hypothetical protein